MSKVFFPVVLFSILLLSPLCLYPESHISPGKGKTVYNIEWSVIVSDDGDVFIGHPILCIDGAKAVDCASCGSASQNVTIKGKNKRGTCLAHTPSATNIVVKSDSIAKK